MLLRSDIGMKSFKKSIFKSSFSGMVSFFYSDDDVIIFKEGDSVNGQLIQFNF